MTVPEIVTYWSRLRRSSQPAVSIWLRVFAPDGRAAVILEGR